MHLVVPDLSCVMYFPNQGLNPSPLHWELGVLASGSSGKSLSDFNVHILDQKFSVKGQQ